MLSETKQPTVLNLTQEADLLQLLPRKPLLSSQELHWDGVCVQYHCQPAWETPYVDSSYHSIIVNHGQQIQTEHWLDNRKQKEQTNKGEIVVIPANTRNKHIWDREGEFFLLCLDPTYIAKIAYESIGVERVEILPYFAMPDPLIYQFCLELTSELELGESSSRLYVDSLVTALSIHLIRKYSAKKQVIRDYTDGLSKSKLQRSISYINEHLTGDLSLKAIALEIEMSPHYFTSLFKQSTGMSAYQYVIHCRIERAKHLLSKQDLSVTEVSQQVGFESQSHFTNVFRKHTNTTPKMYQRLTK